MIQAFVTQNCQLMPSIPTVILYYICLCATARLHKLIVCVQCTKKLLSLITKNQPSSCSHPPLCSVAAAATSAVWFQHPSALEPLHPCPEVPGSPHTTSASSAVCLFPEHAASATPGNKEFSSNCGNVARNSRHSEIWGVVRHMFLSGSKQNTALYLHGFAHIKLQTTKAHPMVARN